MYPSPLLLTPPIHPIRNSANKFGYVAAERTYDRFHRCTAAVLKRSIRQTEMLRAHGGGSGPFRFGLRAAVRCNVSQRLLRGLFCRSHLAQIGLLAALLER